MASENENRSYADLTASNMDRQRLLLQIETQASNFRLGDALRLAINRAKIVSNYRTANSGTVLNPSSVDRMSDEEVLRAALLEQFGKSKLAYISADNRTPLEKQRLQAAFKIEAEKEVLRNQIETNSEAMDRTFGAIPIVGSTLRAGRTQLLRDLNGYSPYGLLDAGSTLLDLGTSAFGFGGWKPLVGGYVGGEVGRLIGEKYDYPVFGLFAGALTGGFTPLLTSTFSLMINNFNKVRRSEIWYNGRKFGHTTKGSLWLGNNPYVARGYGEDVKKILVDPKDLNSYITPKSEFILEWSDLPFKIKDDKLYPSKVHKPITIEVPLRDGTYGLVTFISRPLPLGINDTIKYMNELGISRVTTDDIVHLAQSKGYNSTRMYNLADGPATDGVRNWVLPIDELVLHKGTPYYTIGLNLSKWSMLPQLLWSPIFPYHLSGLGSLYGALVNTNNEKD